MNRERAQAVRAWALYDCLGTGVKALTLYPEHAELFCLGLRSIETRSKPTKYRGPLLLHAGMRDEHSAVAQRSPRTRAALDAMPHGDPLTHGAVVASATLTDCGSIVGSMPEDGSRRIVFARNPGEPWRGQDVPEAEIPFGDYSLTGRYAWLLEDVKPTSERCPRCWGQSRRCPVTIPPFGGCVLPFGHDADLSSDHLTAREAEQGYRIAEPCATCGSTGRCEPIPMRGRLGLWDCKWEVAA